ncbi:hypothetical protein PSHI8_08020 [Polynucleobacter sp. SHI8]|nr:hypothetical protein PSHI2_08020 [Polynucleobacter sp. SHI2]BDW13166.1 hypothetical protein PSHI8_08020 [Polynucleobacter sp. SHI8]
MNYIKITCLVIALITLWGCDRRDYVTWKCQPSSPTEKHFTMILEGSNLKIDQNQYSYCGSLGPVSYFNQECPPIIDRSEFVFEQKLGILMIKGVRYQCNPL